MLNKNTVKYQQNTYILGLLDKKPRISEIHLTPLPLPSPRKVNFPSSCAYNTGHFLTFIPDNLVYFYTKNAQKVDFSSTKVGKISTKHVYLGLLDNPPPPSQTPKK